MSKSNNKYYSETIKLLRLFHALSQREACLKLGFEVSRMSRLETGNVYVSGEVLERCAEFFNIKVAGIKAIAKQIEKIKGDSIEDRLCKLNVVVELIEKYKGYE